MPKVDVILLCGKSNIKSFYVFNYLSAYFSMLSIRENKPNAKRLLLNRRKKLGFFTVFGQILFQVIIQRLLLKPQSRKRILEIEKQYKLDSTPIPNEDSFFVDSINDSAVCDVLIKYRPKIVIVIGTRIIQPHILNAVPVVFINMHAGVTPMYRGVHGAYWALANDDKEHCGVTIHAVDEGIDTGSIIFQEKITPTKSDNFLTYPVLQCAEGLPKLKKAIDAAINHSLVYSSLSDSQKSKLWYHPTLGQYIKNYIRSRVK